MATACLAAASWAQAGTTPLTVSQKTDSFVQRLIQDKIREEVSVIVKTGGRLGASQAATIESLGGRVVQKLGLIGSVVVQLPGDRLAKLATLRFVERVSLDAKMVKKDEFTFENSMAAAAFAASGLTGRGVTVAVLDSGIDDNDDLDNPLTGKSRILNAVSFAPKSVGTDDRCGHGTHVAGIIAGNGFKSSGNGYFRTFYGLARKANLLNVRVLDAAGSTNVSNVVSAIQWVVSNKSLYGVRVINLSLGHEVGESYKTDPLCQALEKAWKAGIVVVCAAGNEGRTSALALGSSGDNEGYGTAYGSVASPGNDPYVITVGAMKALDDSRSHDTIATYSSRGPARLDYVLKPDIIAPGNQVISLRKPLSFLELTGPNNVVPTSSYCSRPSLLSSSNYFKMSGTSMATPVVAGAVAMMLEADPSLTPDTVKARLMVSADKWAAASGDADPCTYGAGYLNVAAAVNNRMVLRTPALSPSLTLDSNGNLVVDGDPASGVQSLWGGATELRAVWGSRAVWGTNKLNGNRALWGSSVWSNRAMWGTSTFSLGDALGGAVGIVLILLGE
ncbi:MAG: S8 family peptidase [Armatimonadetes bacterium]|nr:S8 family peptidase [Armatimonadota bacterium]